MNRDLISVIVPVYNIKDYVGECIDSIITQTYKNIEIIVVDDGSTDGSGELCEAFLNKDRRIIVYHKKNGGLSSARNYGIDRATGQFLIFVDGDDTINPTLCEELHSAVISTRADIGICRSYKEKMYNNEGDGKINIYSPQGALVEMFSEKSFNVSACGKIYKYELFNSIRFPEGLLYEDLATTYRLIDESKRIVALSRNLYYYRTRNGSIMKTEFNDKKAVFLDISEKMIKYISEKYPMAVANAINRTVRYCISFEREIALSGGDHWMYAERLRSFISANILRYTRSNYKLSSKIFGMIIVINLRFALKMCSFICG